MYWTKPDRRCGSKWRWRSCWVEGRADRQPGNRRQPAGRAAVYAEPAEIWRHRLRGFGPVRDRLLELLLADLGPDIPALRLPINVDAEQLLGGLDLTETLSRGRAVRRPGLLERADGGVLIVTMAERMAQNIAAHLAQAMDHGEVAVILLDDGMEADEAPPRVLLERVAFHCDLTAIRTLDFEWVEGGTAVRPSRAR